ncbi:thiamine pyrophosphate-binding protein [Aliikangiella coralliicola]|uniref:thiamine pyrophosphate-binding protein n=1 Tax=Aliikangiella coralliicola TaxID=2592383 RepID=UPI001FE82209|nr:thiamine pyrophosphate-binding protein [Aliikangiella coralliicola]
MELIPRVVNSHSTSCADLLIDFLTLLDIPYIFGVPGGNIDPLCNRLSKRQSQVVPKWILTRSEAGAAYMADGYFRETGKIGVCGTTSGPGATNLITPISNAFVDNVPMLAITAQTPISTFGRGGMQETSGTGIDSMLMFQGCTRYNSLVSHPDQLVHKLHLALSHALGLTPGPVHLSIPSDILAMPIKAAFNDYPYLNKPMAVTPDKAQMKQLISIIKSAKKAVFALGPGAEEAMPFIMTIAEAKQWPIVTFPMSRGLINAKHPLFRGVFGTAGHESARKTLSKEEASLIFVVGADLDESATCGWDGTTILSSRMIHISNNPELLSRSYMARLNILGNPLLVFTTLADELGLLKRTGAKFRCCPNKTRQDELYRGDGIQNEDMEMDAEIEDGGDQENNVEAAPEQEETRKKPQNFSVMHWEDCINDSTPLNPRQIFTYISSQIPGDTRVYIDTGNSFFWSTHYWMQDIPRHATKNHVKISMGYASMGWAISAAIGCKFANPKAPVLCITGDGSMMMSSLEMTLAQEHNLNIVFIVMNNACLGTIKHGQRLRGFDNTANELPQVNFALVGQALGIPSYRISNMEQIRELDWCSILSQSGPMLLDMQIDAEVAPPIGQRVQALDADSEKAPTPV